MSIRNFPRRTIARTIRFFRRLGYVRKCRLYCVGTAKSGTHSIASMFDATVSAGHEPDARKVIRKTLAIATQQPDVSELADYVRKRDKRLRLDVDSSQLNFFLLDALIREFDDALFLLTIRDCYSWLDSFINDSLRRGAIPEWTRLRELRFRADAFVHPPEERALKERGLYTLDGYLSYWSSHNQKVVSSVPAHRLLIVKTREITKRSREIAIFAGLSPETIRVQGSHSFANPQKYRVLHEIDRDYLEMKVGEYCAALMKEYFPEIQSISDADI